MAERDSTPWHCFLRRARRDPRARPGVFTSLLTRNEERGRPALRRKLRRVQAVRRMIRIRDSRRFARVTPAEASCSLAPGAVLLVAATAVSRLRRGSRARALTPGNHVAVHPLPAGARPDRRPLVMTSG